MLKRILYATLVKFVKVAQAIGRAAVPIIASLGRLFGRLLHAFTQKLIFVSLKIGQLLKRYWQGYSAPLKDKIWFIVTSPWTLRVAVLGAIFFILAPQTTVLAGDVTETNLDSLLYRLVGPGEEYFVEESIDSPIAAVPPGWSIGAVRQEVLEPGGIAITPEFTELGGLALGGTAVIKPIIIPGAQLGLERKEIITYLVQAGDTIGGIAEAFGLQLTTILWENNLSFRSYIQPGNQLRILPVDGIAHEVKRGDTIAKIAKTYAGDATRVIEFNKLADAGDISIGQKLVIPGGIKPAPVYRAPPTRGRLADIAAPLPSIFVPAGQLYVWPTTVRHITQYFRWRHTGLDIGGPIGTPLIASRAGRVVSAKCGWNGGYGCHVILDHGDGIRTMYAHASRVYVDVGETVAQGQTIAGMGSTGRSTGSHIHFEIRVNGVKANPLKFVR